MTTIIETENDLTMATETEILEVKTDLALENLETKLEAKIENESTITKLENLTLELSELRAIVEVLKETRLIEEQGVQVVEEVEEVQEPEEPTLIVIEPQEMIQEHPKKSRNLFQKILLG